MKEGKIKKPSSKSGNKTPNPAEGEAVKSRKRKTPTSNNSSRANSSKNCQKTFNLSASQKDKFFFNLEHEQAKNFNIHEFKTPYWATTEKRRAPIGAFPGTKNDPTSLYIPPEEKNKLTPAMRQY